jgi:hypothetical protein
MKRNSYKVEHNKVSVKITEKQFDRLYPWEILELLIKKGLPIEDDFDNVSCFTGTNKIPFLNCFKRSNSLPYTEGKVTSLKLIPLWLI